jgi:DNA anti-recombination protein RmuC
MAKGKKGKRKSASRLKYEAANPPLTMRLPRELSGRFKEDLRVAGWTSAQWMRAKFGEDEAKAEEFARRLAERRDGLGEQVRARSRELAGVEDRLKERQAEIAASVEEERRRLMEQVEQEVEQERQRRLSELDREIRRARAQRVSEMHDLEARVEELTTQARQAQVALVRVEMRLRNREGAVKELAQEALDMLRKQGYPYLACVNCPGYAWLKLVADMASRVAKNT